jgi:predicted MFS family arabinose efflux permease
MSISFVPLKMAGFNAEFLGLSQKLVCSLPISVEMAMTGIFVAVSGFFCRWFGGWRPLFILGLVVTAMGYFMSGLAEGPGAYIMARGLVGAGYGMFNMAAQIFVVSRSKDEHKGEALGDLFAGFFSGGLCGCAAGGLLADRFGYNPVFFGSAITFGILGFLTFFFFHGQPTLKVTSASAISKHESGKFFSSFSVWNFSLFCVIPGSLALVGLINYFLPMHLSSLGAGPAAIGQLNALFSILVVLIGPIFGRCLDRSLRPWLWLVLGGVLAALAFPSFLLWPSIVGTLVGLILLGLSNAVSESGGPTYLLSLKETELVGTEQSLSFFNAITRVGHVLGPLVLAAAWGLWGLVGLGLLGGVILLCTFIFWVLAPKTKEANRILC